MTGLRGLLLLLLALSCQAAAAAELRHGQTPRTMWMLNCQGCHRADGNGTGSAVPPLSGLVSHFLSVPGGREYLIRVPGVAGSPLPDGQLTELVNWMFQEFDPGNIPAGFVPYTEQEITALRQLGPYGKEAGEIRAALLQSAAGVAAAGR
jgi:hypothetical protein